MTAQEIHEKERALGLSVNDAERLLMIANDTYHEEPVQPEWKSDWHNDPKTHSYQ